MKAPQPAPKTAVPAPALSTPALTPITIRVTGLDSADPDAAPVPVSLLETAIVRRANNTPDPTDTPAARAAAIARRSGTARPKSTGKSIQFDAAYRFLDARENTIAYLEPTGRFAICDSAGSLEAWEHARFFIVDVLKAEPATDQDDMLDQLWEVFGQPHRVDPSERERQAKLDKAAANAAAKSHPQPSSATGTADESESEDDTDMATRIAKKAAGGSKAAGAMASVAAKRSAKSKSPGSHRARSANAKPTGPLPECGCGCGDKVGSPTSKYKPGHDARFHGYIKKYQRGEVKLGELPGLVQSHIRKEGIKVKG